jgi:hypothetical protein
MNTTTQKPGLGQYALAAVLGLLAISAGGISLSMNAAFGLQTGIVMAAIFVLSDGAKIILPMADAALGGSSAKRRIAYWTAVLISVLAATSYLLETQATRLLTAEKASETATGARTDAERIRGELAGISEQLGTAALVRLTDAKKAAAEREAGRGKCGPLCEGLQAEHDALVERLGQANRREALEAQLAATVSTVQSAPVEALGSADTIAALTGGDKAEIAQHEAIVKAILMLMILEVIAMFSGDAGNLFVRTWKARTVESRKVRKPVANANAKTASAVANLQMQALATQPKSGTRAWYLARLQADHPELASRVASGELSVYAACIEAGLRKAPKRKAWNANDYAVKITA